MPWQCDAASGLYYIHIGKKEWSKTFVLCSSKYVIISFPMCAYTCVCICMRIHSFSSIHLAFNFVCVDVSCEGCDINLCVITGFDAAILCALINLLKCCFAPTNCNVFAVLLIKGIGFFLIRARAKQRIKIISNKTIIYNASGLWCVVMSSNTRFTSITLDD